MINLLVNISYKFKHSSRNFQPGKDLIPVTSKVFDKKEIKAAVRASLDFWLTAGPYTEIFEKKLARFIGIRSSLMVNSGSSANLLAITALTSESLGDRALRKGDEVITVATSFPTTVAPIIQNGLIPVYLDVEIGTYVANTDQIKNAITDKTKAVFMAHTLGNPFDVAEISKICKEKGIWLIEDNCDGLGGTFEGKKLGSFGDISTLSFYPAHHITTGEGGAVLTNQPSLKKLIESFRDWGRDCWCLPGCDNTCAKRFDWQLGNLPKGYDHKYTYSHIGYNLKSGDIQAAIGEVQLDKLDGFIAKRRANWKYLELNLKGLQEFFILPTATDKSNPSWFGFALTLRPESGLKRSDIIRKLEEKKIATRLLFGGNLLNQPAFMNSPRKIPFGLENSDLVMTNTFWLGVWPGLNTNQLDYVIETLFNICRTR